MSIRYFCDRCDSEGIEPNSLEVGPGVLRIVYLPGVNDGKRIDICEDCENELKPALLLWWQDGDERPVPF